MVLRHRMAHIGHLMKDKTTKELDKLAAVEKAIAQKYGSEAVQNPRSEWTEEKEKEYIEQMKYFYKAKSLKEKWKDKIDVNGIKATKKLLNRESLKTCSICGAFPKKSMDDVCLLKFECCSNCYIQHIEGREERWEKGWKPNET